LTWSDGGLIWQRLQWLKLRLRRHLEQRIARQGNCSTTPVFLTPTGHCYVL